MWLPLKDSLLHKRRRRKKKEFPLRWRNAIAPTFHGYDTELLGTFDKLTKLLKEQSYTTFLHKGRFNRVLPVLKGWKKEKGWTDTQLLFNHFILTFLKVRHAQFSCEESEF